jgi:Carboxypeptidase regulatory-like domain
MKRPRTSLLVFPVIALMLLGACASGAAAPSAAPSAQPSPSAPAPSASVALPITTPDAAAALVIASDPRFKGVAKKEPGLIGACCFYEASALADGTFAVKIEIGWGDCPAGCINRHTWSFVVTPDGAVTLKGETGPPLEAGSGGSGNAGGGVLPSGPGIAGQALAGPTCPVVQPGDPNCNDRPVSGATILIRDATGTVVAQVATDANGRFQVVVPPGSYLVEPQPVEGLMGTAQPIKVTVGAAFQVVDIAYDTGIR